MVELRQVRHVRDLTDTMRGLVVVFDLSHRRSYRALRKSSPALGGGRILLLVGVQTRKKVNPDLVTAGKALAYGMGCAFAQIAMSRGDIDEIIRLAVISLRQRSCTMDIPS